MKKLFIGVAVALAMCACTQEEAVLTNPANDVMSFNVQTNKSRAAESFSNVALPESFTFCAATADNAAYLSKVTVSHTAEGWTPNAECKWPGEEKVDFFAVVDNNDDAHGRFVYTLEEDQNVEGYAYRMMHYVVEENVADQKDLMYAVATEQTKANNPVNLNFRHALTQISFDGVNFVEGLEVEISNVAINNIFGQGNFTLPQESTADLATADMTTSIGEWHMLKKATAYSVALATPVTIAKNSEKNDLHMDVISGETLDEVFAVIPQTLTAWDPKTSAADFVGTYMSFEAKVTYKDNVIYEGVVVRPFGFALKQGAHMRFAMVFSHNGLVGYTPDPVNPEPIYISEPEPGEDEDINFQVTVDDYLTGSF